MPSHWIILWIALAIVLVPLQFQISAPYGRHARTGWGPMVNARIGWIVMEVIAPVAFLFFLLRGTPLNSLTCVLAGCFVLHYVHRSLIYPLYRKSSNTLMPLAVVLMACVFNLVNGGINGDFLAQHQERYDWSAASHIRVFLGFTVFVIGAMVNIYYDRRLIAYRKASPDKYVMPQRGLFRWVSCPNHFGEIIEWTGFAIMCWNLPALAFVVWTVANLIPRSWHHHIWYRKHFPHYPPSRKAVIPWVI